MDEYNDEHEYADNHCCDIDGCEDDEEHRRTSNAANRHGYGLRSA